MIKSEISSPKLVAPDIRKHDWIEPWIHERLVKFRRASQHALRYEERRTLKRIMYRNRNQHSHGMYWKKLCMFSHRLDEHDKLQVFQSVIHLDEELKKERAAPQKQHSSKNAKHMSRWRSVAKDQVLPDLEVFIASCSHLLDGGLLKTAVEFEHMIAATQFVPFGLLILSILARLFSIESRLRSEAQVLAKTLREELAGGEAVKVGQQDEDLGVALPVFDEADAMDIDSKEQSSKEKWAKPETQQNGMDEGGKKAKKRMLPSSSHPGESKASLYDIFSAFMPVMQPTVMKLSGSDNHRDFVEVEHSQDHATVELTVRDTMETSNTKASPTIGECDTQKKPDILGLKQFKNAEASTFAQLDTNAHVKRVKGKKKDKKKKRSCQNEIDDIFGLL